MRHSIVLALIVVAFMAVSTRAQDKPPAEKPPEKTTESGDQTFTIAPRWKKGETQRFRNVVELDQVLVIGENKQPATKNQTTMITVMTCTGIDDAGVATVTMKYEQISSKQTSGETEVVWDSTKPDEGEQSIAKTYQAMIAGEYTLTFDATGRISAAKGFDAMVENLVASYPEDYRETMKGAFANMSDKGMLRSLKLAEAFYPAKPVALAGGWDYKTIMQMGSNDLITTCKLKLESVSADNIASIKGDGTSEMKPHEKVEGQEDFDTSPGMAAYDVSVSEAKTSVEITFDLGRGVATKTVSLTSMKMSMTPKRGGQAYSTVSKTTNTIELLPQEKKAETAPEGK